MVTTIFKISQHISILVLVTAFSQPFNTWNTSKFFCQWQPLLFESKDNSRHGTLVLAVSYSLFKHYKLKVIIL